MIRLNTCLGCTRFVILTKKYAIKIPQFKYQWRHFLLGLLANMQEVQFSKMKDERLCPVKFYLPGGWMVVMPRCEMVSIEIFSNIDINKFWPIIPVEYKQDSFGLYKGKVVAIDYGS